MGSVTILVCDGWELFLVWRKYRQHRCLGSLWFGSVLKGGEGDDTASTALVLPLYGRGGKGLVDPGMEGCLGSP